MSVYFEIQYAFPLSQDDSTVGDCDLDVLEIAQKK